MSSIFYISYIFLGILMEQLTNFEGAMHRFKWNNSFIRVL